MQEIEFLEQNNTLPKIMEKKIMVIIFCLSLFLFAISGLCAISQASRPTTYGILLGLSFSWFSLFILWVFLIYDSKLKLKITFFAGIILWLVRTFFLLIVLLIIIFLFLDGTRSTNYVLQIFISALFSYSIPMFTVIIFWIEETII